MNDGPQGWTLISSAGGSLILLGLLSLYTFYAILDRSFRLLSVKRYEAGLFDQALGYLSAGKNRELAQALDGAGGALWARLLRAAQVKASERRSSVLGELESVMDFMERPLIPLATIGATAPFIGLFGTVLGVMKAFHALAESGGGGMAIVGPGITDALRATAVGLFVAIPAVAGYNLLGRSTEKLRARGEALAAKILDQA